MIWDVKFRVEVPTQEKAEEVRDRLNAALTGDPEVTVSNFDATRHEVLWTCYGWDTTAGQKVGPVDVAADTEEALQTKIATQFPHIVLIYYTLNR